MFDLESRLLALADPAYADFNAALTPGIPREAFLGIRTPALRAIAKELVRTPECTPFLHALPHRYYDQNMLHAKVLSELRDFDTCVSEIRLFLPYIDNWAVCDSLRPSVFKKHRTELLPIVTDWIHADHEYTCRFGIGMLMTHWLDDAFSPDLPELPAMLHRDEYYIRMMVAWYFATALAKQWDATYPYIEQRRLPSWIHAKTIQKACESYRVSDAHKSLLRTWK